MKENSSLRNPARGWRRMRGHLEHWNSSTQPSWTHPWRRMRGHLEHWNSSTQPSWTHPKVMFLLSWFWMLCSKGVHSSCKIPKETLQKWPLNSQVEVWKPFINFISVQFSCWVLSDSLRPHESQHARPPCPSPTPGVHSDSRPSSQ